MEAFRIMSYPPVPAVSADAVLLVVDDARDADVGTSTDQVAHRLGQHAQIAVAVGTLATPPRTVVAALEAIATTGQRRVVVVPLVVGSANPLLADLAGVLRSASTPTLLLAEPLGTPLQVVSWLAHRARTALAPLGDGVPPADTALLVVGHGGGEPFAHAEVYQIARLLSEGRPYGCVEAAFAHGTSPSIAAGLHRCVRLGARRVVVLPLTLLPGPAHARMRDQVRATPADASACEVVLAEPLLRVASAAVAVEQRAKDALQRWAAGGGTGLRSRHTHAHADGTASAPAWHGNALLPPRYQDGTPVSAAPMAAAPLQRDADGQVAWDRIWGGDDPANPFCDLALAGGAPHRGTLLEPVAPADVAADPEAYRQVLAELTRGLQMVTGLRVFSDAPPGWIGIACLSEEMALWLLRAIVVENISVRREDRTLFVPAGPTFRVEHEIKNIVTAVAKTYHYWTEHQAARAT